MDGCYEGDLPWKSERDRRTRSLRPLLWPVDWQTGWTEKVPDRSPTRCTGADWGVKEFGGNWARTVARHSWLLSASPSCYSEDSDVVCLSLLCCQTCVGASVKRIALKAAFIENAYAPFTNCVESLSDGCLVQLWMMADQLPFCSTSLFYFNKNSHCVLFLILPFLAPLDVEDDECQQIGTQVYTKSKDDWNGVTYKQSTRKKDRKNPVWEVANVEMSRNNFEADSTRTLMN